MDAPAIPALDRSGLRRFGLGAGAFLAVAFGLILPWALGRPLPTWPWWAGGILTAWALLAPETLGAVYRSWMRAGRLIAEIINGFVLGLVFLAVLLPLGLTMRLLAKDPLARRFDSRSATYRVPSRDRPASHMERPF